MYVWTLLPNAVWYLGGLLLRAWYNVHVHWISKYLLKHIYDRPIKEDNKPVDENMVEVDSHHFTSTVQGSNTIMKWVNL